MTDVLLGIDVGLSALKVAAFDAQGRLVACGQAGYTTERPAPGLVEQDPEAWIDLAGGIVRRLLAEGGFRADDVSGIAPSARGSGTVFVDADGRALANHWLDDRNGRQYRALVERFGPEADNRAQASKTLHFKERHPELFARLAHVLCVHDFLLYRLTGQVATDPSSGPRNPGATWPTDVWSYIGATPPPIRPHTDLIGRLIPATAERLGLPPGIPIANGGHDGACANVGAGAIGVGHVCLTMGTNAVARSIAADRPDGQPPAPQVPWRGISAYHFLPGRWCCGGDANHAGAAATWLARALREGHEVLEAEARRVPPGSNGVVFLPFLGGQIAPERRPAARAAYLGMAAETGRGELYRATMEGVAYLYRSIAHRLEELGLCQPGGEWRVSGGGARNQQWMEIMASLVERPLAIGEPEEGPRGAAMLTVVALGWYPSVEAAAADWVRTVRRVEPDPRLTDAYLPHYDRYRRLAEAVHAVEGGT
ncbi:MAG TPA: FGGY family carbohydrate kinase [Chloroflexota bacterium]|jgi:gluconokinase